MGNFEFHHVLCTTPPELEDERQAFEGAVAQFVEQVSMPDGVLFAPASLRPPVVASRQKAVIESNIRMCEFVLAVFGEQWPDPVFGGFVDYALECVGDAATATRRVAVLFRNYADAAGEVRSLRERLAGRDGCEAHDFRDAEELGSRVRELLTAWYAATASGSTGGSR